MPITQIKQDLAFTLDLHRCFTCGRFYATEAGFQGNCPICGYKVVKKAQDEEQKLMRVISALRGVITKRTK